MRLDWKTIRNFITTNNLYNFVNYVIFQDYYYIWTAYQGQNLCCMLDKGSVDCQDFITNFLPRAIIKNDIADDGQTVTKITHVKVGRTLKALFCLIETCTKTTNDVTGYISVKLFDEHNIETTDGTQVVKTCVDFCPNFNYEIFGGGLIAVGDLNGDVYVSSLLAPAIPAPLGNVYNVINKKVLSSTEDVFITGIGTAEIKYNPNYPVASVLRIILNHDKGAHQRFQIQIQYYASTTSVN